MKAFLTLFGIVTLLLGVLPFLQKIPFLSFLSFIPSDGTAYSLIITVVGVLAVIAGFRS